MSVKLGDEILAPDLFANKPAFGQRGRLFPASDLATLYRDSGSAWVALVIGASLTGDQTLSGQNTFTKGLNFALDTGAVNACVTATALTTMAGYPLAMFLVRYTNTGPATLAAGSIGATAIKKNGTQALTGGELQASMIAICMSDGTYWQLLNPAVAQSVSAVLTNDVTITYGGTFYDAISVSLTPGSWLLWGQVMIYDGNNSGGTAQLWDKGSNILAAGSQEVYSPAGSISLISLPTTVTTTTSFYISATAQHNNCKIKATDPVHGLTNVTQLTALRIG